MLEKFYPAAIILTGLAIGQMIAQHWFTGSPFAVSEWPTERSSSSDNCFGFLK